MIPMTSSTAGMPTSVPAFIAKLWHMVSDESCDDLISWSEDGTSFVIKDQARFCSHLLPRYYKHNNMASFIRQLNKYGFHKVSSIESSSLRNDKGDFEFAHEFFVRGCVKSLEMIKRKMTTTSREIVDIKGDMAPLLQQLLLQVQELKDNHETFETKISTMKRENDALWREHSILRQKYVKQQKMINQLIKFLVTVVQQRGVNVNRGRGVTISLKDLAQAPLMAIEAKKKDTPTICEIPAEQADSTFDGSSKYIVKGDEPVISVSPNYVINSPVDPITIIEHPDTSTVLLNPASPAEPSTIEIATSPLGTPGYSWADVPSSSSGVVLGSPISPFTLDSLSPSSSRGANLVVCPQDVSPAIITREYPSNPAFKNVGKASSNKNKSKGTFNVRSIKQEKADPLLSMTVTDNPDDPLGLDGESPGKRASNVCNVKRVKLDPLMCTTVAGKRVDPLGLDTKPPEMGKRASNVHNVRRVKRDPLLCPKVADNVNDQLGLGFNLPEIGKRASNVRNMKRVKQDRLLNTNVTKDPLALDDKLPEMGNRASNVRNVKRVKQDPLLSATVTDNLSNHSGLDADLLEMGSRASNVRNIKQEPDPLLSEAVEDDLNDPIGLDGELEMGNRASNVRKIKREKQDPTLNTTLTNNLNHLLSLLDDESPEMGSDATNVCNLKLEIQDPLLSTTVTDNLNDQLGLDADLSGHVGTPKKKPKTKDPNSSLVLSDPGTRQDLESHLDVVQSDLDSLKDILQGLDTSAFMSLFNDQDPLGLNMSDGINKQQLVSMNPNTLIDISDMLAEEENDPLSEPVDPLSIDSSAIDSLLNTPQPTPLEEPLFNQPKRLRK